MRFVRNAAIPVILIAAIALLAGCSKEPVLAIQDAEATLSQLQAAGAAEYAPQALSDAQNAMAQLKAEVEAQKGKFVLFRSFKNAEAMALTAKQTAEAGVQTTEANKAAAKAEAENALAAARAALTEAQALVLAAPVGKGSELDIKMLQSDLMGVEQSLADAEGTLAAGRFNEARAKAQAAMNAANTIAADVNNAIALRAGKR
ncbi:MAG: hypothetical protein IPK64_03460 [bacterium]|nr:hypothetical protein [bacterium]